VFEHRFVVIEEQRRQLVKTLRWGEVPSGYWDRAGIRQKDGLPLCNATPQFTQHAMLQQALERKIDGGGNAKFQQGLTFAIESTTGKPPADKKNPLQNLSASQLAKVTTLVSASARAVSAEERPAVPCGRDGSGNKNEELIHGRARKGPVVVLNVLADRATALALNRSAHRRS